ncbi:MATE family efflux transporter [Streptococcus loxodontisalivarius]|uniref:Probable multidrug resistance protein NorM n=1 Tax=Streptococcus loxodontisalivarius TaxID=1349415 RepID=A0ABS2PTF0_9STRE|nr:MATE family efflux transporter [Streptococcus loxodontisalivarius]MBM7643196.1 putative MATE family efflux protein [Streptococcus loxodontisalivarius]
MTKTKQILNLALPAMVENILQMLMGVVDSYLVAQVGLVAVSGVSVANNIITIYQAIFIALGASCASLIAKSLGQKDSQKTNRFIWDSILITVGLSLLLGLISLLAGKSILNLLGTEAAVTEASSLYLALVGGGILFLGLMTTFGSILRAQGKPRLSMNVSLIANLLNALLSACAVYIFHWGIAGVAGATVLSRLIGTLILWQAMQLDRKTIQITKPFNRELFNLVLPAAGERLMMRAGDVVIIAIVVKFGTEVVAGNAIGETLTQFNYMPGMGVATATVILVAHSLGSQKKEEIRSLVAASYWISTGLMILVAGAVFLFGPQLTGLFTDNSRAVDASMVVILYSFMGNPVTSGTLIYTATWQGLGEAKMPFYATTFGMWVIRIFAGYFLGISLGLGLAGVWIATVLDNLFRFIFLYIRYQKYMKTI